MSDFDPAEKAPTPETLGVLMTDTIGTESGINVNEGRWLAHIAAWKADRNMKAVWRGVAIQRGDELEALRKRIKALRCAAREYLDATIEGNATVGHQRRLDAALRGE